jgi:hypothetical protein
MKTCETCAHWEVWKSEAGFKKDMGECNMVVMWWNATEWEFNNGDRVIMSPRYDNQRAFVQDGSDYRASLYTRKDFGCVDHKEKNT